MTGRTPAAYVPNDDDDDDDGDTVAFFTTSAGRLRALPETVAPIFIYLFIYLLRNRTQRKIKSKKNLTLKYALLSMQRLNDAYLHIQTVTSK